MSFSKKYDDVGKNIIFFLYLWYCSCLKLVKERFWSRVSTLCPLQVAVATALFHDCDMIIGTSTCACEVSSNVAWSPADLSQTFLKGRSILPWEDLGYFSVVSPLICNHSFNHGQRFRFWFEWEAASHTYGHLDCPTPVSDFVLHKTMFCFISFLP